MAAVGRSASTNPVPSSRRSSGLSCLACAEIMITGTALRPVHDQTYVLPAKPHTLKGMICTPLLSRSTQRRRAPNRSGRVNTSAQLRGDAVLCARFS